MSPETEAPAELSEPRWHRPRTQLFKVLFSLWWFPSLGAVFILIWNVQTWTGTSSVSAAFSATRLEQWVAAGLLLAHGVIGLLARHYRRSEKPVLLPPEKIQ